jgi:hypothetical protein
MIGTAMSDWFDSIARRTATHARAARGTSQDNIEERSAAGPAELVAHDELSWAIEPFSRRTSLKWTLGTALGLTVGPALLAAPEVAQAYFNPAGLTDDTILALADNAIESKPLGQAFKAFGLDDGPFAYVDAAITFYVAAEVLGGDQPPSTGEPQPPVGEPPPSGVQCEPGQIYCGCNGGFCLIAGDCSSYC